MSVVGGVGDLRAQLETIATNVVIDCAQHSGVSALDRLAREGRREEQAELFGAWGKSIVAAVVESEPIRALLAATEALLDADDLCKVEWQRLTEQFIVAMPRGFLNALTMQSAANDRLRAAVARVEGLGVPTPNDQETR